MRYGSQSEVNPIKSVLLKHPRDAFISQENIDDQWQDLNYLGCPVYEKALEEYDYFVNLINNEVDKIYYLPEDARVGLDSMYVHDPVLITDQGAILCNMGKEERHEEPRAVRDYLRKTGVPILGKIGGDGTLEGGDVVWLGPRQLAVGQGYRTNAEGIRQLRDLTAGLVDEFIVVPLVHWTGPDEVLHLMSMISPIDNDTVVVYSRLLPVPFRQWLVERNFKLIDIPDEEYPTMACNILALAPRKCIMIEGNPRTRLLLERAGFTVREYKGQEISKVGSGGPTCLTRPLLRER
ncbi:MAG: arginine deiminase family protein [candidate division Zixibacteria bacterium]|nr:arginine deiminase family protein [candidate division Zixibacteria bacterium]MDD5425145.1 arginine deiminase family protein [candidate division Zixibacteria bacterium]